MGMFVIMTINILPMFAGETWGNTIHFVVEQPIIDPAKDRPRTPVCSPRAYQNEHSIYFPDEMDFFINLYTINEEGEKVLEYSTFISAMEDTVQFPSDLNGAYTIEVIRGEQYFFGAVTFE